MKTFLIGLYGGFDRIKYERDYNPSFFGIEACLFADRSDIEELSIQARKGGFSIGIHYPFRGRGQSIRDALFMDLGDDTRQQAFEEIQAELEALKELVPAYILFHYPKPVILDDRVNWDKWRFADRREYVYESEYAMEEFAKKSASLFAWLEKKGEEYGSVAFNHYPALPECVPEAGWAPIEEYLSIIRAENPAVKIVFEHRSDLIHPEQLEACYTWIDQLMYGK